MVLLLRQSGEIIRGRTSPTRERDNQFTGAKKLDCAGLSRVGHLLWPIQAAGLSLPAPSSASHFAFACSPRESGFYGQTSVPFNRSGSAASSAAALFHQLVGGASAATGSGPTQRPWLNPHASEPFVVKITMCLIVMCPKRYLKFMVAWCPSRSPNPLRRWTE